MAVIVQASLPARFYADLIGKPYRDHGRGPDFYDCFGVLIEVERRMGNQLPDYISNPDTLDEIRVHDWQEVLKPEPGDGILIRSVDPRWHVGVVINSCEMVHIRRDAHVCVERFDGILWKKRIEGFYRWRA